MRLRSMRRGPWDPQVDVSCKRSMPTLYSYQKDSTPPASYLRDGVCVKSSVPPRRGRLSAWVRILPYFHIQAPVRQSLIPSMPVPVNRPDSPRQLSISQGGIPPTSYSTCTMIMSSRHHSTRSMWRSLPLIASTDRGRFYEACDA